MELIMPGIGLIFWMTLSFGIVLFVLRKFAWNPILGTLRERENFINNSLREGQRIKRELAELDHTKEKMILQTKEKADEIIHQAKLDGDKIIEEAQDKARAEADKIIDAARNSIQAQKKAAENEIRQQIVLLSVDLAQKVLSEEFTDTQKKNQYVNRLLDDIKLN
ncbi:MAG: F0F1 ATP synthase subunit B [Bacteroidota bacterium]